MASKLGIRRILKALENKKDWYISWEHFSIFKFTVSIFLVIILHLHLNEAIGTTDESNNLTIREVQSNLSKFNISPDGSMMVYWNPETQKCVVKNLITGEEKQIPGEIFGEEPYYFIFLPDNIHFIYRLNIEYNNEDQKNLGEENEQFNEKRPVIKKYNVHTNEVEMLYNEDHWISPFDITLDGKKILCFLSSPQSRNISWFSTDTGTINNIKTYKRGSNVIPESGAVSPNEKQIAYEVTLNNGNEVYLHELSTGDESLLVKDARIVDWTTDNWLVYIQQNNLWGIKFLDNVPQTLPVLLKTNIGDIRTHTQMDNMNFTITNNGGLYYLAEQKKTNVYSSVIDINSGEYVQKPLQIPTTNVGPISPSGKQMAYRDYKVPFIQGMRIYSFEEQTVSESVPHLGPYDWFYDESKIRVTDWEDVSGYLYDLKSGEEIPYPDKGWAPTLSPASEHIYYSTRTEQNKFNIVRVHLPTEKEEIINDEPISAIFLNDISISADENMIAFEIMDLNENTHIKVMSIEDGKPKTIVANLEKHKQYPRMMGWTEDNQNLYFLEHSAITDDEYFHLVKQPLNGDKPSIIWQEKLGEHPNGDANLVEFNPHTGQLVFVYTHKIADAAWVMENFLPQQIASTE